MEPEAHPRNHRNHQSHARHPAPPSVGNALVGRLGPAQQEEFAHLEGGTREPSDSRPEPSARLSGIRFVAVDCETTGRAPDQIIEIGAVCFKLDRHIQSFETLVHTLSPINSYASRVHGIFRYELDGSPPASLVLPRFEEFAAGSVLVEHSPDGFDTRLISTALGHPLQADSLDTSRMAAAIWKLKDTIGLERLCERCSVQHRHPHRALADAEATAACFVELVRMGKELFGWDTLGDLLEIAAPKLPAASDGRRRRPSRRHAGDFPGEPVNPSLLRPAEDEGRHAEG